MAGIFGVALRGLGMLGKRSARKKISPTIKSVKPNVDCKSVDDACRKYIEEKNYGKYFIHSTGHGIGLEVHEFPTVSYRSNTKLKENMAITVEPGIYIENKFGIRIEDSLIVKNKPIVMHKFTKDLLTI